MNFRLSQEDIAFRKEVRTLLQESLPNDIRRKTVAGHHQAVDGHYLPKEDIVAWQRILNAKGWAVPHWPIEWGGTTWTAMQRYIFLEENYFAPAPQPLGFNVTMIGPILIAFGTDAQKQRFLPRIANLDDWWCQGFSEPGAGSDLSAVRTSARREGDDYVVSGQKIWTTYAHRADWMFCLVRTDSSVRKQSGLSMLLIDMKSKGVSIKPIRTIDGWHHVNEVFLDDVVVPAENRVGEEGKGWDYARYLLGHERTGQARLWVSRARLQKALALASRVEAGGRLLESDLVFRRKAAQLETELKALEITQLRVLSGHHEGPAMASLLKLKGAELQQKSSELLLEVAGPQAFPGVAVPVGECLADVSESLSSIAPSYFYSRAASIYGGTDEIQRTLIARAVLQL